MVVRGGVAYKTVPLHTGPDRAGAHSHLGALPLMKRLGLVAFADGDACATSRGNKRKACDDTPSLTSTRGRQYKISTGVPPQFSEFREACKMAQPEWEKVHSADTLVAIGIGVKAIVETISGGAIPRQDGYVKKSVIRTLICACPHVWNATDWGTVMLADLKAWTPDQAGVLDDFSPTDNAASISSFLFGRPDWGLLVSMWGCMWKPASLVLANSGVHSITPSQAEAIRAAATTLHAETGVKSTPKAAVQVWLSTQT